MKIGVILKNALGLNRGVNNPSFFVHPRDKFNKKPTKQNFESSAPMEFKWLTSRVTLKDVYQVNSLGEEGGFVEAVEKNFRGKINHIVKGDLTREKLLEDLIRDDFTNTEATFLLNQSIYHTLRAKEWACQNEKHSGFAALYIALSVPFAICKTLISHFEEYFDHEPVFFKKTLNLLDNLFCAARGYKQFKIYGERNDEDRAENKYEEKKYGNKAVGVFSDLAYVFETKINPLFVPLLAFTSDKTQKILKPLLSLPNILWWRVRMPNEINQRFATDLFTYLFHKPLALFGVKSSIEKIKKVNEEGNLKGAYINERERKLIGLNPTEDKSVKISDKFSRDLKKILGEGIDEKIKGSIYINKFISPFVGLYGFFSALIGLPMKSVFKFFDKENRFFNTLSQSCFGSQQIIYFFRLMLPEYLENKKLMETSDDKEFQELCKKKNNLFFSAVSVCVMNVFGVLIKLVKPQNNTLKMLEEVYDEVADKGIPYYLSKRRSLLGESFKIENPELYESQVQSLDSFIYELKRKGELHTVPCLG